MVILILISFISFYLEKLLLYTFSKSGAVIASIGDNIIFNTRPLETQYQLAKKFINSIEGFGNGSRS